MTHTLSRSTYLAGIAATAAVAAGRRASAQAVSLRIGLIPFDAAAEPLYAKESGIFAKLGIEADLLQLPNGPAIASAVAGGAIEIGYSNGASLSVAHEKGLPFKIIFPANMYLADEPTIGLLSVRKSSAIRTAKDFNGKTIGVGGLQTIVPLCARLWIDQNGGDSSTVKFVETPFSEMFELVRSGRIDAAQMDRTADPNLGKPDDPLRVIAPTYSALSKYFASSLWFTSTDFIAKNPDKVLKFNAAMRETALWARTHHHESAVMLAKYVHQTAAQVESIPRVYYGTDLTPAMVQPVIDLAARYGMLKASFPATDMIVPPAKA